MSRTRITTTVLLSLLLTMIGIVCVLIMFPLHAAPLRCKWIDGSEVNCLVVIDTVPINTLRVIEAPLFADSFEG